MRLRTLLCTLALLLPSAVALAQTGKITGKITDAETGLPLPFVNVVINELRLGAATDEEGDYVMLNIPPGQYDVSASYIGFGTLTKTDVRINIDQTTQLDFALAEAAVDVDEIVVSAERPPVEIDLTGSKEIVTAEDFSRSWIHTIDDAVEAQSGVNIHGGIRGSFGMEVAYIQDGMDLREAGSNTTFLRPNTTAVSEVEVLTGGWNAEYPQATGGIVNVVTKRGRDHWRGSVNLRMRPADKYHWGRYMYSQDNFEYNVISKEWFENNSPGEAWLGYWRQVLGEEPSPEFMWEQYQDYMTPDPIMGDYMERHQYEGQATFYGPITSQMDAMISGRYLRGVSKFPTLLPYNPEWNALLKLNYDLTNNTRLQVTGSHQGTDNAGAPQLAYGSSQDRPFSAGAQTEVRSPFDPNKWYVPGAFTIGGSGASSRAPQYIRSYIADARLTHMFSPTTFAELSVNHQRLDYESNFLEIMNWTWEDRLKKEEDPLYAPPTWFDNAPHNLNVYGDYGHPTGDILRDHAYTRSTRFKADLTSQLTKVHQVKGGVQFNPYYYDKYYIEGGSIIFAEDAYLETAVRPWEGALYLQDKIETQGMIINAGLRVDMFNANKTVNYTIFDPMALSDVTLGNRGRALLSFDPNGPYARDTPTRVAISPRIGVSHPLTENTVLHFMYGHFNQRPAWSQIVQNPMMTASNENVPMPEINPVPEEVVWAYRSARTSAGNPALEYQKMVQYEVGFEQNIVDLFRLDVTMYYKAGKNLTNIGFQQGPYNPSYGTTTTMRLRLAGDPNSPFGETRGANIGVIEIPINGGRMDVRGLETTFETRFWRYVNARIVYNMSYARTGVYGPLLVFREFERDDRKKLGVDQFFGGGTDINEVWNPHNTLKLTSNIRTPERFGPSILGINPLADWNLGIYYQYASPQKFTYHSAIEGDLSTEPRNRKWKPHHKTNLSLGKGIPLPGGTRGILSVDVINVFNQRVLNLPGGEALVRYMEHGELPTTRMSYIKDDGSTGQWEEVNEWGIYSTDLMPREVIFSLTVEL